MGVRKSCRSRPVCHGRWRSGHPVARNRDASSVTTRKRFFRDLTDALRDVEGVAVTGIANESETSIRGMPGEYTPILVEGSAGMEQSFIPPAEAIERIEVVRGPMSSLYGSDAIGGVINIIARKVPSTWSGSVNLDHTAQQPEDHGNGTRVQSSRAVRSRTTCSTCRSGATGSIAKPTTTWTTAASQGRVTPT
ncbi:MAG TPA: TonB-dependent receptor plug domain-containing protein [Variovorax sp.]|nr:TonB-dependent receptor plug domain-containing protein [Variovorax sp.]